MLGRPTCIGSANIGGAPLMARSVPDLTTLYDETSTSLTSFIDAPSLARIPVRLNEPSLATPAAPKPAATPLAFMEVSDLNKGCLNHRYKHKLGQSLHRLQFERVGPSIPAAHHQASDHTQAS